MTTKHDQIIQHIKTLPIGERISVRSIAKQMGMSDGTAYRAIKDAENIGLVSTIERVGTIRIEKKSEMTPEMLTFGEVVRIIDGEVLGGVSGLDRHLNKFIIGAMTEDAMVKYFTQNSLIIVGNRESVQKLALSHNVAVLITGGFKANQEVIDLANEKELPVLSTTYDTFAVASIINRSMIDQEIKQEIMTVNDIYTPIEETVALTTQDTVETFHQLANETGLSRFPVHYNKRLIGIVTAKDLIGRNENVSIERVMTKNLVTVQLHMSVVSVSHKMTWEDIEMIPVVADNMELLGVVSRQDLMKAMQLQQQQPQKMNTYEDDIRVYLEDYPIKSINHSYNFRTVVKPHMINNMGTISYGVLVELITQASYQIVLKEIGQNHVVEKVDLYYFNLIQLENELQFEVNLINRTRRQSLVEVNVYHENSPVAKAILTCQMIERG